jgi:predicted RNase H-like HicB family nuclease
MGNFQDLKVWQRGIKEMKFRLTEEIWKEGNMYVSYCPELDVASCGEDVEQAKKNLVESIIINIEETKKLGTFEQFLEDSGLEENIPDLLSARKELVGFTPIELHV